MDFDVTKPREWQWRTPQINTTGRLYKAVKRHARRILDGNIIVVDPSIGSKRNGKEGGSEPGYAIGRQGALADHGVLEVRGTDSSHRRLFEISRSLREDFGGEHFAVLVIEAIPVLRFEKFGRSLSSQLPLHWACGAAMSAVDAELCFQVAPQTWHSFAPLGYVKSDAGDAVCMLHAVLAYARHAVEHGGKKKVKAKRTKPMPVSAVEVTT